MEPRALGAYPSPSDYRDGIAVIGTLVEAGQLPSGFHTDLGTVLDQNQIPACVAHSITYLIRLYWFRKLGHWIDFSPRFLDILSAESWIPLDGGRVPRTVLKVAVNQGCATTATLPNDTSLPIAQYRDAGAISDAARTEALQYRIPGFIRISIDPNSTREGITLYGALSTLFMVGNELWTPSWADSDIDPLRTPAQIIDGHQMTPNGYDSNTLDRLRNSWGPEWANKGECDYDESAWNPYITEQWAVAEIPSDLADFLKQLPAPADFHFTWNTDMHHGDRTEDVKWLQVAYMILGYLPPIPPDQLGIWGPKTDIANARFQSDNGISPVPGSCGHLTRGKLNSKFSL